MGKVDDLKALREARYAAMMAAAPAPARVVPKPAVRPAAGSSAEPEVAPKPTAKAAKAAKAPKAAAVSEPAEAAPAAGVCGHKNMSNRSCQRPAGHAEKSHRYK